MQNLILLTFIAFLSNACASLNDDDCCGSLANHSPVGSSSYDSSSEDEESSSAGAVSADQVTMCAGADCSGCSQCKEGDTEGSAMKGAGCSFECCPQCGKGDPAVKCVGCSCECCAKCYGGGDRTKGSAKCAGDDCSGCEACPRQGSDA